MTRYRIRKNCNLNHWIIYRHTGVFGWWPITAYTTWTEALASVNRRIRRACGTQSDYALAAPGDANG